MLDPASSIQFGSVFPKKAWITLGNADMDPIGMAWRGFGQMHHVRKQAGVQESLGSVVAECILPTTSFPLRFVCILSWMAWIILCKISPDPIWFELTIRFWPNGSGPDASRCVRIIWPASGQCFQSNSGVNRIQHVYWVVTNAFSYSCDMIYRFSDDTQASFTLYYFD